MDKKQLIKNVRPVDSNLFDTWNFSEANVLASVDKTCKKATALAYSKNLFIVKSDGHSENMFLGIETTSMSKENLNKAKYFRTTFPTYYRFHDENGLKYFALHYDSIDTYSTADKYEKNFICFVESFQKQDCLLGKYTPKEFATLFTQEVIYNAKMTSEVLENNLLVFNDKTGKYHLPENWVESVSNYLKNNCQKVSKHLPGNWYYCLEENLFYRDKVLFDKHQKYQNELNNFDAFDAEQQ